MPAMSHHAASERLSPIQFLMLKLLAERHAQGEMFVDLPVSTVGAAKALAFQSLVTWDGIPNGIRVYLTEAGVRTVQSFTA